MASGRSIPSGSFFGTNMSAKARGVVHFYKGGGTAKQWIKESTYALNRT
jgi:hypothetical protein